MWRQLILFLVFCFSLSFLKVCEAYEWVPGTAGSYNTGDWQKMAGMYSTALPGFDGWLWAAYCRNSLETDSKGFVKGKFEVGGLMYCVAYAVRVSSSDDEIRLQYHENSPGEGFYLFNTVTKEIANLDLSECQKFDCIALYMSSASANGRVPLNPGARLNIFDYSYSMPRTDARIGFQSSNYRDFFKRCQVQGFQTGETVKPDVIDIDYTGAQWFPCARIFLTSRPSLRSNSGAFLILMIRTAGVFRTKASGTARIIQAWCIIGMIPRMMFSICRASNRLK